MAQKLTDFLEDFLKKKSIFKDKKALQSNYTPKSVLYRGEQINQVAGILAPALRMEKPSNLFIYGKVGTGKTLVVKHVMENILDVGKQNKVPLRIVYLNCKLKRVADTEYRLIAEIARGLDVEVPATGLPTDEVYKSFIKAVDEEKKILVIVLDEIDQLVKKTGDTVLYNLTRLNAELKNGEISLIGISNDLTFTDNIDPRVKSSLSEEELVFPPYNAVQLQKILMQRAKVAFHDGVIGEGVVEKCAALAAREHGDARRALELLRVAAELVERKSEKIIIVDYVDKADEKIDGDRILDVVTTQPKQFKLTLYSIFRVCNNGEKHIFTGDIYGEYRDVCSRVGIKPLTQRRVGDIIAELDLLGIISARVVSKGRHGRTREISLAIPESSVGNLSAILKDGLGLGV